MRWRPFTYAASVLALAAAYTVAARLGLSLAFVAEQVTVVWPPTGIALVALLLFGYRWWPGITLGAFVVNCMVHAPVPAAVGIAMGNTLEAVVGVWLLRQLGCHDPLRSVRNVLGLVFLAAGLSTTVSATIGVTSLCLGGVKPWSEFSTLWGAWWLGDAMGDLVFAPALLAWTASSLSRWNSRRVAEFVVLLGGLAAASIAIFASGRSAVTLDHPFEYAIFPFVIWAGLRFGQRGSATVPVIVLAIAVWGTINGSGPFARDTTHESLILLEIYLAVVTITGLVLGAAIMERTIEHDRESTGYAVTAALAQANDLAEVASELLRAVCEGLDWDLGVLWTFEPRAGRLNCVAVWHRPGPGAHAMELATHQLNLTPGAGLPGRIWASGQPIWTADLSTVDNFLRAPSASQAGLQSAFGFPILSGHNVLGVVEFFSRQLQPPDQDLLQMMTAMGSQIGLFLERRRAEETLRLQAQELLEAAARKDDFLAMLAHELRNPLAPIRNALYLLGKRPSADPVLLKGRDMMERQVAHLTRLVDDLLDVSRIARGKIQLHEERLDLARLVRVAAEDQRSTIEWAGLTLYTDVPEVPVWVSGDMNRLAQVLDNLIGNAAKFTDRGGEVHVALTINAAEQEAELTVRDTGIGIDPVMLRQLFEPFVQADRSLERSRGGLGLGLSLVKGLVELHNGDVTARSDGLGRGATVTVRLPVQPEPSALSALPQEPVAPDQHLRIVVVEDNRDAAESLRMLLEMFGYQVALAHTGPDGVKLAESWLPDVVVCDIGLPGLDGCGVARVLRGSAATAKTRLIALTGYGQDADRARSREAGFDLHLTKPVDPEELHRALVANGHDVEFGPG